MISHGHELCGSNRVSHRLSDWDVAWFTRSLQLNFACTSAPLLPTWHAQRQVESRRCSAGLTLKDFERSNEFKWQIMRCISVWIFFGILQNPSDSLVKATERTNLDATCHDFPHHIITPAFSSIPSTSIRRTLHLNLVKLDDIWGMSSLAAALAVWFVQDFKELCDVFVSILMFLMAFKHGAVSQSVYLRGVLERLTRRYRQQTQMIGIFHACNHDEVLPPLFADICWWVSKYISTTGSQSVGGF